MADITRSVRGRKHPRNPGQLDLVKDTFTKALLHFNGPDGSTTIEDEYGHTWTCGLNAQIDTAQSKFGTGSLQSDGSLDYVIGDGSSDFAFGTGDFTVDFQLRLHALGNTGIMYDHRPGVQGLYPTIQINTANQLQYVADTNARIFGSVALSVNTWYHIAIARASGNTRLFINGTQDGSTYSDSHNYINGANRPILLNGYDGTYAMWAHMDELRISKGIARWTSNFTPPTQEY